jgi:ATP-dependent Clp protease protease subunit
MSTKPAKPTKPKVPEQKAGAKCDDQEIETVEPGVTINEEKRQVFLVGAVGDEMAKMVLVALSYFDESEGEVDLVLVSGGGSESAGWAIYDAIRLAKNPVRITAFGLCQSMAALILQAADKRVLAPECRFMIHNGSVGMEATVGQVRALSKEIEFLTQKYYKTLSVRSGVSISQIKEMCDKETFLSAEQTVKLGFADKVLKYNKKLETKAKKNAKK